MSESYKEQRPLLSEDLSDEEVYGHLHSPYQRRAEFRGHARNKAKGTATIIATWPDQWSYLAHIWLILGMFALIVMIIYNVIIAIYILPAADASEKNYNARHVSNIDTSQKSKLPEVFMHLLTENNEEVDYHKYLPYMKIITEKFPEFRYNLYIVLNDTSDEGVTRISAEENNDIALNAVLSGKKIVYKPITKLKIVNVEQLSLSRFMDDSPLKMQWRHIASKFIPFLVRAISVWDRGGIAFDPIILTPNSPDSIYFEKVQNILSKYVTRTCVTERKNNDESISEIKEIENVPIEPKKKLNNIQEILEALDSEDGVSNHSQHNLTEAEAHNTDIFAHTQRKLLSYIEPNNETFTTPGPRVSEMSKNEIKRISKDDGKIPVIILQNNLNENNVTKKRGLYAFFDNMFRKRFQNNSTMNKNNDSVIITKRSPRDTVIINSNSKQDEEKHKHPINNGDLIEMYKPMIISPDGKYIKPKKLLNFNQSTDYNNLDTLTIDLKGNIVATETACHAFIGNVFSSVVHHTSEESLTDFLIAQLSIFCKGLLSTCKGLDIIIL